MTAAGDSVIFTRLPSTKIPAMRLSSSLHLTLPAHALHLSSSPSPSMAEVKIMKRERLAAAAAAAAAFANATDVATSETSSRSASMAPLADGSSLDAATVAQASRGLSLQDREAAYQAARARIFKDVPESSDNGEQQSADGLRLTSTSGNTSEASGPNSSSNRPSKRERAQLRAEVFPIRPFTTHKYSMQSDQAYPSFYAPPPPLPPAPGSSHSSPSFSSPSTTYNPYASYSPAYYHPTSQQAQFQPDMTRGNSYIPYQGEEWINTSAAGYYVMPQVVYAATVPPPLPPAPIETIYQHSHSRVPQPNQYQLSQPHPPPAPLLSYPQSTQAAVYPYNHEHPASYRASPTTPRATNASFQTSGVPPTPVSVAPRYAYPQHVPQPLPPPPPAPAPITQMSPSSSDSWGPPSTTGLFRFAPPSTQPASSRRYQLKYLSNR